MRTKLYSLSALSTELSLDRRTVAKRLAGIPPDGQLGQHPGWALRTAWPHLAETRTGKGASDVETERCRLLKTQADRSELQLARERGELVCAAAVAQTWARTFTTIRDLLRAFPRASAERLMAAAGDGRAAFAAVLLADVDDALTRASTVKVVVALDPTDDDGKPDAAA